MDPCWDEMGNGTLVLQHSITETVYTIICEGLNCAITS